MTNLELDTLQAAKHYFRRNTSNNLSRAREAYNMFAAAALPFWLERYAEDADLDLNKLLECATTMAARTAADMYDALKKEINNEED